MAAVAAAIGLLAAPMAQAEAGRFQFDIPAENTAKALNDFARQSGIQLLFPYDAAVAFSAPALKGSLTREEALERLLANTNLEVASATATTITLRVVAKNAGPAAKAEEVIEVVVTGTHIRGGNPTSPVHTVTRKDIEQSGYSQVGDLMRSLPENFSGGQNPGVAAGAASIANVGNSNISNASTVNLRGLGSDATLVLINGHRLSADSFFQGSDISGIPLGAIQRVEVLTDGASALYGSDAVAGVVNFILRKNYNGGELTARIGGASQGGGEEQTYSVLQGVSRSNWYALANAEYSTQKAITWGDRAFTPSSTPENTLLQPQNRSSLFLSAGRDLTDHVRMSFDGLVSERDSTRSNQSSTSQPRYFTTTVTPAYSAATTLDVDLPQDWKLRVTGVASGSRNNTRFDAPALSYSSVSHTRNKVQYVEMAADGTLFRLPTGDVKMAVGGGRRDEGYRTGSIDVSRTVNYVFGELLAPLVAPSADRKGLHELELSLSARAEDYSDFGQSTNPRVGLRYVPFEDLTLRGTWGKSLKAPSFDQMYSQSVLYLFDAADLGYTGAGQALLTYGGNPNLKPETSTSWTFGGEYRPPVASSLRLSATYFDIDYTDRIVQPVSPLGVGLSDPIFSPFVDYAPSSAMQADLFAAADDFANFSTGAYDPANLVAVLRDQYANATAQTVKGLDVGYRQSFILRSGDLSAFANATWLRLRQQTIVTVPSIQLSGTIYNVPKFKARAGLSWQRGGFSATGIANYIAAAKDTGVVPNADIGSWTTFDATLAYRFSSQSGLKRGAKIVLSASNLFDRNPPYTASGTPGLDPHFDSTNASIVGRFVSLTLAKAW
jgi:outer membrane receptor protein involved in Fe transport